MKKFSCKILLVLFAFIVCFNVLSFADVGNFESYDSDWGSSSDWGSDYGSGSYYGSSDGGSLDAFGVIVIIIIIIILVNKNKGNNLSFTPNQTTNYTPNSSSNVLEKITEVDPYFNEAKFLTWSKNLFVKLQNAWTARNFEEIRTFETEDLFEQHSNQIKQYINNKQINVMDRIAVNYAKLYSFEQDEDKDTLSIILNSSMADYIIDENTKEVLQGDKVTRRTRTYKMTFIRKKGVKTMQSTDELKTTNCPNCGAPTKITSSGKCEYCGSVITTGSHDWVLSNLEPFRN